MDWFRNLFAAAHKLTPDQRRKTVRIAAALAAVVLFVVLLGASRTAVTEPGADHPVWEVVVLFRLALARTILALALLPLAVFGAVVTYQALENSELGKRLLVWREPESFEAGSVQAQKTANGGRLLATLLAACIIGLLVGVLR